MRKITELFSKVTLLIVILGILSLIVTLVQSCHDEAKASPQTTQQNKVLVFDSASPFPNAWIMNYDGSGKVMLAFPDSGSLPGALGSDGVVITVPGGLTLSPDTKTMFWVESWNSGKGPSGIYSGSFNVTTGIVSNPMLVMANYGGLLGAY